jgi:hypothetical protein
VGIEQTERNKSTFATDATFNHTFSNLSCHFVHSRRRNGVRQGVKTAICRKCERHHSLKLFTNLGIEQDPLPLEIA